MCRRGIAARAVLIARRIRRIQAEIRRGLYRVAIVAPLLSLLDRQRKQAVLLRRRAHRCAKTIEGASSAASCPIHAPSRPSFVTSASMRRVALFRHRQPHSQPGAHETQRLLQDAGLRSRTREDSGSFSMVFGAYCSQLVPKLCSGNHSEMVHRSV